MNCPRNRKEKTMSKKLIVAMALSLVLVSGGLFSAQADCCLNASGWHSNLNPCGGHSLCCSSCSANDTGKRDAESANNAVSMGTDFSGTHFHGK
jgi:hypothetical protein